MSMSFSLQYGAEWLRTKYGWTPQQCGVQYDCLPPNDAAQFYVALDDGGIETGPENTEALTEICNWTIGIWRKPEHLQLKDRRGLLQLPHDKYLVGSYTLHDLERKVLVSNPTNKLFGFHKNWEFMKGLNARFELPHQIDGDAYYTHMVYKGRGRMEMMGIDRGLLPNGEVDAQCWFGYKMRFRGLARTQATNLAGKIIG